jgi:hypothetical protein
MLADWLASNSARDAENVPDDQRDFRGERLLNALGRERWPRCESDCRPGQAWARGCVRDEDGGGGRASLLDALLDRREDGLAEMLGACLLGVRAADNVRACISTSMGAGAVQGEAHTVLDGLAGVEAVRLSTRAAPHARRGDSRSLLAREALEQHLGVAVDAQVLDCVRVGRGARCVCVPGGCSPHRRAQGSSYGLHRDGRGHGTDACGRGRMDGWSAVWVDVVAEGVRSARVPVRTLAANLKLYSCSAGSV